ncbi:MAG: biotin--[acetyl-CoA-carboxylase] ligase [Butyrivibrio sp.]|nr:biotin--[acetyl-CoA-carboxylase] ligase [Butyrivibrio sp.]
MKEKILAMLRQSGGYVSGQELCEGLGVSRTAVWKAVGALKESGYEIESVRNRGYRLKESPDVLLAEEVKSLLDTEWFGREILYFDTVDSTNNEIKRQAEKGGKEGLLVIAESQSTGRGRQGRMWQSPSGSGIWMSFLLRPRIMPEQAAGITLVSAMGAAAAVREELGIRAQIKWPNDIVINGRKLTGILVELSTDMESINYVAVGIGINVNNESFPRELEDKATSLLAECGHRVRRSRLVAAFGRHFERCYKIFIEDGDMRRLKAEYEEALVNKNAEVIIIEAGSEKRRRAVGINDAGELIVEDSDGNTENIRAGEVSVRGVYGYT